MLEDENKTVVAERIPRTYDEWNRRLIDHYFFAEGKSGRPVTRVAATPEELAGIVGLSDDFEDDVARSFVDSVRSVVGWGTSLSSFVGSSWRPSEDDAPHFFGVLYFTCLVAHGYPDGEGGIHLRMRELLGKTLQLGELPEAWEMLAEWTKRRAELAPASYRSLELPEPCDFRTNVGYSWLLAFPHRDDCRKLREVLMNAGLLGDDPSISAVVDALSSSSTEFSEYFRKDLEEFERRFVNADVDVRKSPFWTAVRRECIGEAENGGEEVRPTLRAFDYDGLRLYVACAEASSTHGDFEVVPLNDTVAGVTHFLRKKGESPQVGMSAAVEALLNGKLRASDAVNIQVRRGVIVFEEADVAGEYIAVSGSAADGASRAIVSDRYTDAFVDAYGGRARPSISGWHEIYGCRVAVSHIAPAGLEHVSHLRRTQMPPRPRLVGGIRCPDGFFALEGYLPSVRFTGAERVLVYDEDVLLCESEVCDSDGDIVLPRELIGLAPGRWSLHVCTRTGRSEVALTLVERSPGTAYGGLPSGSYEVEASHPGGYYVVRSDTGIPLAIPMSNSVPSGSISVPETRDGGQRPSESKLRLRDGVSAIANRRKGFARSEFFRLMETTFRAKPGTEHVPFDLLRAHMEMGVFDLARERGWPGGVLVPRAPLLVAYEAEGRYMATLLGLATSDLEERLTCRAAFLGADVYRLPSPNNIQIAPLRLLCDDAELLRVLSRELESPGLTWLDVDRLEPTYFEGLLRTDAPPTHHAYVARYDFEKAHFSGSATPDGEVQVRMGRHASDHAIYALEVGEETWGWTKERHIALLVAYELREGKRPFALEHGEATRTVRGPYLPLSYGRLCTVLGEGAPGPTMLGWEGWGYSYPFGKPIAERFLELAVFG